MYTMLMRYATPLITGLFVVSLVSGVALFFHIGQAYFHGMHEWLSMVLILPFILHLLKNWRPFLNYFRRSPMAIALALSLVAALPFVYLGASGAGGGNPVMGVVRALEKSTLANAAPVFGKSPDALKAALEQKGYSVASTETTLGDVAKASSKESFQLIGDLTKLDP
ncbi:DUF4405 domain-containing protein [Rhizobium sp. FKL33]|uniref:DUF4405 domain-containing protein n=1 Tax=Rhizobium sp. FKL33 TaxID=2562307 RepID=UPI0010C0873F|nr:DUF4405 domain-containing protein [Rhizobium sp. FKL33]